MLARNNCQDLSTTVGMKTTQDVGNCGDEDHCQYHLGIDIVCAESLKVSNGIFLTTT